MFMFDVGMEDWRRAIYLKPHKTSGEQKCSRYSFASAFAFGFALAAGVALARLMNKQNG